MTALTKAIRQNQTPLPVVQQDLETAMTDLTKALGQNPYTLTDPQGLGMAATDLTEAIRTARKGAQEATNAATEYGKIKGALRTHSEKIPRSSTSITSKV